MSYNSDFVVAEIAWVGLLAEDLNPSKRAGKTAHIIREVENLRP
ncbi:hypothetical protein [Moorena sp. SIO3H5]|nr:hypothetical protein [Moorena sp. SIO3H5]